MFEDLGLIDAIGANPVAFAGSSLALGLLAGSFLNVVILRLPRRLEWQWKHEARELLELPQPYEPPPPGIVVEASHCPNCGHKLAPWENVPLLSYLALRGRCRKCRTPISAQYPAVELATGLLFLACALHFGYGPAAGLGMVLMAFLVACTGIDLRTTLLPDDLTLPLLWIGLLASIGHVFVGPIDALLGAAVGYLSLWSVYWGFKLFTGKEGMGHGDFKLMAALGAWCGLKALLPILLIASLVGAILGGLWLWWRGSDRATPIPFGPFLAVAGAIQFFSGLGVVDLLRWAKLA
jgi:leader peptidase (prepilin peptidase)/N-methyltransferase